MPGLSYGETFSTEGIFKLYTNNGFGVAWDLYQLWCIEMLNQEIAGASGPAATTEPDGQLAPCVIAALFLSMLFLSPLVLAPHSPSKQTC